MLCHIYKICLCWSALTLDWILTCNSRRTLRHLLVLTVSKSGKSFVWVSFIYPLDSSFLVVKRLFGNSIWVMHWAVPFLCVHFLSCKVWNLGCSYTTALSRTCGNTILKTVSGCSCSYVCSCNGFAATFSWRWFGYSVNSCWSLLKSFIQMGPKELWA
jgi:hypothetical protein